jgi:hypothetical protein
MAQGDLTLFDEYSLEILSGTHDQSAGGNTFKVSLHSTALPAASASAPSFGDWTECSGSGYTTGGESITTGQSVSQVSGSTYKWDSTDNPSWAQNGSGPTDVIFALIYNDTDAGDKAVGFIDMTTDGGTTPISLQAGNISITWNASGILTVG